MKKYTVWLHVEVEAETGSDAQQMVTEPLDNSDVPMSVEVDDVIEVDQ
jgi:hypothetical protein